MWHCGKGKCSGSLTSCLVSSPGRASVCALPHRLMWEEALLVIPSRWGHDSQNGPVHLFFVLVLSLLCFPHLLPPCECWWLAGVTEPLCRLLMPGMDSRKEGITLSW